MPSISVPIQLISHVESLTCTMIVLKSRQPFVFSCLVHYSIVPLALWSSTWLMQIIMQNFHKSEIEMGSLARNGIKALESLGLQSVAGDNDAVSFHWLLWTLVVKEEWLLFCIDLIYSNTSRILMRPYIFFLQHATMFPHLCVMQFNYMQTLYVIF